MDLLKNLNVNLGMICVIHNILVLLKNHLNYLKDNISNAFLKKYNRPFFFKKKTKKLIIYNDGKSKA